MVVDGTVRPLGEEYVRFVSEAWPDPRPFYDRLRAEAPVFWTPLGHWYVSRYAEASAMWKDNEHWSQHPVLPAQGSGLELGSGPAAALFAEMILRLDGIEHERIRGLVNPIFSPPAMEVLAETVKDSVNSILDLRADNREMDFLHDFAQPLPTTVVVDLFGIDRDHYDTFVRFADVIIEIFEAMGTGSHADDLVSRADEILAACYDLVISLAEDRRRHPAADTLSRLVQAQQAEPDRMTDSELVSLVMFIVTAGFETTMYTVTNMIYHLLLHPDQFALVRSDPSLVRSAVEEALRYEPGVYISSVRFAVEDMDVAGQHIRRGDKCLISNHAANHDPDVFESPNTFDITRSSKRQISFGRGRHTCLGAHLARLEMVATLEAVIERLPDLELVSDEVEWTSSHVLRGPTSLRVRW
jgi:cytochrome P450